MASGTSSNLVVCGGVHGDEPSGAAALELLAREGFETVGPCNPWGLAHGTRGLEGGSDLNRRFADPGCLEASRVRAALSAIRPDAVLDLHEDAGAVGPYLIQYGPGDDLASRVVSRLSSDYHFEARPQFGPVRGRAGVLRPSRATVALVGLSRRWPLVYWSLRTFGCTSIVVEVPGRWPLEARVRCHCAIARAARDVLRAPV